MDGKRFLDLLRKSGLGQNCDASVLGTLETARSATGPARALLNARILTAWQCEMLLNGQYRGFFLGRYELLDALPPAEYRRVFLARNIVTHRHITISLLPGELHGRQVDLSMLRKRLWRMSEMEHPAVAAILDAELDGDVRYIARELVAGPSLREAVEELGALPCAIAATVGVQVAISLASAHARDCFFGCLEPKSLVLCADGLAKLVSLGLPQEPESHAIRRLLVREQMAENFLAPWAANNGARPSAQWDLFSLGCVLFFALTGREPKFDGFPPAAFESFVGNQGDRQKEELQRICSKLFATPAAGGGVSAQRFADDLAGWLDHNRGAHGDIGEIGQ